MYEFSKPSNCDIEKLACMVEDQYGISIESFKNISDRRFAAETREGILIVERLKDRESQIIFAQGLYDYILSRGFKNIVKMYFTKYGKYYFIFEGQIFGAFSDAYNKHKPSFKSNEENAARLLANFHKCAEGYIPPAGGKCRSSWGKWLDKYRKKAREIKKYRQAAQNRNSRTRFDDIFLKNCDLYIGIIEQSVKILKGRSFLNIVEQSMRRGQICLNDFKPSNLCMEDGKLFIRSLEKSRYDIIETDIAEFLKEIIKSDSGIEPSKLINAYNDENSLSQDSIDIIKALLIFPDEFEKVCSRYYSGKDKWTEDVYISKLYEAMAVEEKKMDFAKALGSINIKQDGGD